MCDTFIATSGKTRPMQRLAQSAFVVLHELGVPPRGGCGLDSPLRETPHRFKEETHERASIPPSLRSCDESKSAASTIAATPSASDESSL